MRIAILGSEGFVGRKLSKALSDRTEVSHIYGVNRKIGYTPQTAHIERLESKIHRVYTCLENEQFVRDMFKHIKPDIIFHLASTQGKDYDSFIENVSITNNIVKHCADGVRLIYLSSSTVYGNLAGEILTGCREFDELIPTNLYAASKIASEAIVNAAKSAGKFNSAVTLRPCAIIGPTSTRGAVTDIIKKVKGEAPKLELFGEAPGSVKPFLSIEDMIGALLHFGFGQYSDTYNISPADYVSVEDAANLIMKELGVAKPLKWLGNSCLPIGDNPLVCLDNEKALAAGWSMKFPTSIDAIKAVCEANEN